MITTNRGEQVVQQQMLAYTRLQLARTPYSWAEDFAVAERDTRPAASRRAKRRSYANCYLLVIARRRRVRDFARAGARLSLPTHSK